MVSIDGQEHGDSLIKVRNLNKVYRRGSESIDVLQGSTWMSDRASSWPSWGPAGPGKTTLLNLLGGLDAPTAGTVTVDGDEITHMSGKKLASWRARHVGFIFQMYNLIPVLTAFQNVELPLLLTKLSKAQRRQHVETALTLVGLRRPDEALPAAALRRPGAAGGHRPRHRHRPDVSALRRADRRPRPQVRRKRSSIC